MSRLEEPDNLLNVQLSEVRNTEGKSHRKVQADILSQDQNKVWNSNSLVS